jgi:diaminopimelate dehydrogenase
MGNINFALRSYGRVGKAVVQHYIKRRDENRDKKITPEHNQTLVGVIRRACGEGESVCGGIPVVTDVNKLVPKPEVVVCATLSEYVREYLIELLEMGIATVDCFARDDETVAKYQAELDKLAKANKTVSILNAGWGAAVGVFRDVYNLASTGPTHISWGPGVHLGRTGFVKTLDGVEDALVRTVPVFDKFGTHIQEVLVVAPGHSIAQRRIESEIRENSLFKENASQKVKVKFRNEISNDDENGFRHGVQLITQAGSAAIETKLRCDNPKMTAAILSKFVPVAEEFKRIKQYGCFTPRDIAPKYYSDFCY